MAGNLVALDALADRDEIIGMLRDTDIPPQASEFINIKCEREREGEREREKPAGTDTTYRNNRGIFAGQQSTWSDFFQW